MPNQDRGEVICFEVDAEDILVLLCLVACGVLHVKGNTKYSRLSGEEKHVIEVGEQLRADLQEMWEESKKEKKRARARQPV